MGGGIVSHSFLRGNGHLSLNDTRRPDDNKDVSNS